MPIRRKRANPKKSFTPQAHGKTVSRHTASRGQVHVVGKGWGVITIPRQVMTPAGLRYRSKKRGTFVRKPKLYKSKYNILKIKAGKKPPQVTSRRVTTGKTALKRRGLSERGKTLAEWTRQQRTAKQIVVRKGINIKTGRKWHGPPGSLGDDVIVEVLPTVDLAMEAARPGITGKQVDWSLLWGLLEAYYQSIVRPLKQFIGQPRPRTVGMVPTDTGDLRLKMWTSLERHPWSASKMPHTSTDLRKAAERGDPLLLIVLNTGSLKYAKPVNQMSTEMLAHPHDNSRNFGRGGSLYDPTARTDWWQKCKDKGRNEAKTYFGTLHPFQGKPKFVEVHFK